MFIELICKHIVVQNWLFYSTKNIYYQEKCKQTCFVLFSDIIPFVEDLQKKTGKTKEAILVRKGRNAAKRKHC